MEDKEIIITMEETIIDRGNEIQKKQSLMHTLVTELQESKTYVAAIEKELEDLEISWEDSTMEELELLNFKKRMMNATKARIEELWPQVDYSKEEFFKLFNV